MSVKKTKKEKQSHEDLEKDISQYTLPTPVENTISEAKNDKVSFSPNDIPDLSEKEVFWRTKMDKVWISVFVILIVFALVSGMFIYKEDIIKSTSTPSPVPTLQPKADQPLAETPTAVDFSKYKITVLNGSGAPGEAAKAKILLEKEKLTVYSIDNADRSDYQKTVIQAKKTVPEEFIDKLKLFLKKSYDLDDTAELAETNNVDVVIILSKPRTTPQ